MNERTMANALLSGVAGAAVLTVTHEVARRLVSDAPRMDLAGRRALASGIRQFGMTPPSGKTMQELALAGDIVSNSLYYSLVAAGGRRASLATGALLGALAGWGAVTLTPRLGLGERPASSTRPKQAMAFAWYLLGGLAAAATFKCLESIAEIDS